GELYEVAGHLRAGKTRIHGVCEHAMQSMAEFVEHGGYIAEADEGGLAGAGLGEIGDVEYHRYQAEQFRLAHKNVHPRAAVFVVALEVVAIPESERFAVGIENLEHANVRMVDGNVGTLFESDAVELIGD